MSERKRSANWLIQEKKLLLDLVADHFTIVENKKTDSITVKQKNLEWEKIADEFNSQTTIEMHRTAENLKAQWESLKKTTKKAASLGKQSVTQTGGGSGVVQTNDQILNKVMRLISTTAVDLMKKIDRNKTVLSNCEPPLVTTKEEIQRTKMKALEMQLNFAEAERDEARKLFEINYEIRKEVLKQEKLKTRLLLLQVRTAKKQRKREII